MAQTARPAPLELGVAAARNMGPTNRDYHDSFGPSVCKKGIWTLWNVMGTAQSVWTSLQPRVEEVLRAKRRDIQAPRFYKGTKEPLLALRCYMIGTSKDRAHPYVAILCRENWFSAEVREILLRARCVQDVGWGKRIIRLTCEVRQPGPSEPKGRDASDLRRSEEFSSGEFSIRLRDILSRLSLLGSKVDILHADKYLRTGTLGGTICIANRIYGMTVAHLFAHAMPEPSTITASNDAFSDLIAMELEEDDLDLFSTTSYSLSPDRDTLEILTNETPIRQSEFISDAKGRIPLQFYRRSRALLSELLMFVLTKAWLPASVSGFLSSLPPFVIQPELDWAIFDVTKSDVAAVNKRVLESLGYNSRQEEMLVTSIAQSMPSSCKSALLVTTTAVLPANYFPSSSTVSRGHAGLCCTTCTAQIQGIRDGDCGSWLIDEETKDFLGILVATCDALEEAYIIPAKDVFANIFKLIGIYPRLPTVDQKATARYTRKIRFRIARNILYSKSILVLLSAWGFWSLWGFPYTNGLLKMLADLQKPRTLLVNTNEPMKTHFTGNEAVDKQLTILVASVYTATDGNRPDVSLSGLNFGGQVIAAWILIAIEGMREGNRGKYITLVTYLGACIQNIGFACIAPLWMALHLATSQTMFSPNTANLTLNPRQLASLPVSILIGCVFPSVVMCLSTPTVISHETRQNWTAVQQAWPLWIYISQEILTTLAKSFEFVFSTGFELGDRNLVLKHLRVAYVFALCFSASGHLIFWLLCTLVYSFPVMWNPDFVAKMQPVHLIWPQAPFPPTRAASLADGVLWILQWEHITGMAALVVWSSTLRMAIEPKQWTLGQHLMCLTRLAVLVLAIGPAGAAVAAVWQRDELVFKRECQPPEREHLGLGYEKENLETKIHKLYKDPLGPARTGAK